MVKKQNGWRLQSPSNIYDLPTQQILLFSSCCIGTHTSSLTICMIDSPINKWIPMPPTHPLPLIILKVFINWQYNSTNWFIQKQRTKLNAHGKKDNVDSRIHCACSILFRKYYWLWFWICDSFIPTIRACDSDVILDYSCVEFFWNLFIF